MMGGGIRQVSSIHIISPCPHSKLTPSATQSGALAAAASLAITNNFPKLAHTHQLAAYLGKSLEEMGCQLLVPVETNMVFFNPGSLHIPPEELKDAAALRGVSIGATRTMGRLVVHHQISREAVDAFLDVMLVLKEKHHVNGTGEVLKEVPTFAY